MANVLAFELNKKAEWRDQKAEKHSEDARNAQAAKLLRDLADQSADADLSARFEALSEAEAIGLEEFNEAVSDELTDIGFRSKPKNVDEVLRLIIQRIEPPKSSPFNGIGLKDDGTTKFKVRPAE
ncbi:hypothetical protein [Pararhizobium gei]|uniref:hypothetical protein n=1 Tax=Pararhizobium gei TaxID=1395951 RepID=UPI0023DCBDAF|nr:hypothetical protein [Rhizobium gei]